MTALPLTVVGGYLGAGKTTLINRLLANPRGRRLMVFVNDFGAINIDAALLRATDEDKIELTNGCVCCTLSGHLFQALCNVLDRPDRPDHLIVEASGISDPAKIAHLAFAEPDLEYAGIITVVDGAAIATLSDDPQIGPQYRRQIEVADLLAISKAPASAAAGLERDARAAVIDASDDHLLAEFLFGGAPASVPAVDKGAAHPGYVHWVETAVPAMTRGDLVALLASRPNAIFRLKGFVPAQDGGHWEVQIVGRNVVVAPAPDTAKPGLVAIGLSDCLAIDVVDRWWRENCPSRSGISHKSRPPQST